MLPLCWNPLRKLREIWLKFLANGLNTRCGPRSGAQMWSIKSYMCCSYFFSKVCDISVSQKLHLIQPNMLSPISSHHGVHFVWWTAGRSKQAETGQWMLCCWQHPSSGWRWLCFRYKQTRKRIFCFVFRHKWTHRVPVKDQAVPLHIVPLLHAKIPQGIGTFWIMTATKMKLDHQNHNKNLEKDVAIPTFLKSNWLRLGFETRQDTWDNNDTALWSTANVIIGCLFWGNRLKIPCCSAFLHLVPLTTGSTLVFPLLKEILSYSYSVFHVCVCIFVSPQKLFHWKKNSFLQSFKYKKLAKYLVSYLYFLTVLNC